MCVNSAKIYFKNYCWHAVSLIRIPRFSSESPFSAAINSLQISSESSHGFLLLRNILELFSKFSSAFPNLYPKIIFNFPWNDSGMNFLEMNLRIHLIRIQFRNKICSLNTLDECDHQFLKFLLDSIT